MFIPGVITQSTVLVDAPELVAQRIGRFAGAVGAGKLRSPGLTAASPIRLGSTEIHPSIAWAKLDALVEGARLASEQLW